MARWNATAPIDKVGGDDWQSRHLAPDRPRRPLMEPRPKGDPGAIAAISATLAQLAAKLESVAAVAPMAVPAFVLVGAGRGQHDHALQGVRTDTSLAATELMNESKLLANEAKSLQHRQDDWDHRKQAEQARQERESHERAARARAERTSR